MDVKDNKVQNNSESGDTTASPERPKSLWDKMKNYILA